MTENNEDLIEGGLLWDHVSPGKDPVMSWNNFIDDLNQMVSVSRKTFWFPQHGGKTGQMYYEHAVKGIHAMVQVIDHVDEQVMKHPSQNDDSMKFLRMLCVSYLVHDLNKFPGNVECFPEGKRVQWTPEELSTILDYLNSIGNGDVIDRMFPNWDQYMDDMMILIKGHSKIYSRRGDELLKRVPIEFGGTNISFEKSWLETGVDIMRFVDALDLVKKPGKGMYRMEGKDENGNWKEYKFNHDTFFAWLRYLLTSISGTEMEIKTIRVVKEASRFTNILLNQAINALKEKEIHPLRTFTTGCIMYGSVEKFDPFFVGETTTISKEKMDELHDEIGKRFVDTVENYLMSNEKEMASFEAKGILPNDFVYQEPNSERKVRKVFSILKGKIPPLKYDNSTEKKLKESSRFNRVQKLDEKIDDCARNLPVIARWENGYNDELMKNDESWKLGRYAHTGFFSIVYVTSKWGDDVEHVPLLKEYLEALGVFDELTEVYDKMKNTQDYRYYFFDQLVGTALYEQGKTMDDVESVAVSMLLEKLNEIGIEEQFINNPSSFVSDHLQLFNPVTSTNDLVQSTGIENDLLCTACGKRLESTGSKNSDIDAYKWKGQHTPDGVPVEKFSNFLEGGMKSKAVRLICHSCMWRHYLDKVLATVKGKTIDKWFATFYMEDGMPHEIVTSMQDLVENIKNTGDPEKTAFKVERKDGSLSIKKQKAWGIMLPSIPNEICGSFTVDCNYPKTTINEVFWDVLIDVLTIASVTRMRCVVTKLRNDYQDLISMDKDIVFQDMPQDFKRLLGGKNWLSFDDAEIVLGIMDGVGSIINQTVKKDHRKHKSEVVKRLDDTLSTIHYIENKWDDDRKKKNTIARARYLETVKGIVEMQQRVSRS